MSAQIVSHPNAQRMVMVSSRPDGLELEIFPEHPFEHLRRSFADADAAAAYALDLLIEHEAAEWFVAVKRPGERPALFGLNRTDAEEEHP